MAEAQLITAEEPQKGRRAGCSPIRFAAQVKSSISYYSSSSKRPRAAGGIARSAAIHGARRAVDETIETLDRVRDLFRKPPERWRPASSLVLAVLLRLLPDAPPPGNALQSDLLVACKELLANPIKDEAFFPPTPTFTHFLSMLPISDHIGGNDVPAELRVRILREIGPLLASSKDEVFRQVLQFVSGYIISRIGGAERDLRLAESFGANYPMVLTWAAVLGGLGARTYWADAFGGMGRLVAREITRCFNLVDPPYADIAADELLIIGREDNPVKTFRTALRQVATISLRPGVVVQLTPPESDRSVRSVPDSTPTIPVQNRQDPVEWRRLRTLAEQLLPHLRVLLERDEAGSRTDKERRSTRRGKLNPELPLKD